ncbi:hypothetical protein G9A89_004552 [Geosiphon pyriformis]|nr:hypothetical protein G9A89_004552 [Geosiphon pyriformis]
MALKSGWSIGDRIPDGVGDHDLNPSKYAPYSPKRHDCQTKSGHHAEKEIGKTLGRIHLLSTLFESLSIIQRTQPKPSDTKSSDQYQLQLALSTKLWRISTNNTKPKVAESETIGANHLGFAKFLFQHYCQYLELNHNYISTKSAFNFYINKEIEHYIQQRYPITYASKGKGKLQTPAVTPRKIQPPAWKKNRVESPSNSSYHYIPGRLRSPPPPPDFGISDPWEAAESEKEKEESEYQEFTYQHPITENPEVETLNIQT